MVQHYKDENQIAVLSDIHGNRLALEAVLEDIKKQGVKRIVDLGDSLYGPLDPIGTAQLLIENNIPSVKGNEDRLLFETHEDNPTLEFVLGNLRSEHLSWIENLPRTYEFNEFYLCHGSPEKDTKYLIEEVKEEGVFVKEPYKLLRDVSSIKQQIILCGHSHIPRIIYLINGKYIINPGSVGLPAYKDDVPYPHIMEAGSPHARYCIITKQNTNFGFETIAVPYNWEEAALMALKNGRTDWATWLRTGRAFL